MITLALIEGKLIFIVVAGIVGAINWWLEKKKKEKESAGGSAQPPPRPQQPAANSGGDEQERLRRFLESLGVPQPPPPQRPETAATAPGTRQSQHIQQRVAQPIEGRMQSPGPSVKKPAKQIRTPRPVRAQQPQEMARAGRIEEAASSIERISGEFSGMNVRVKMDPLQTPDQPAHMATGNAGTTSVLERSGSPIASRLRRLLHNSTDLRAAFVAMEVLGTPRGLQN